jgi:hypothetical protein
MHADINCSYLLSADANNGFREYEYIIYIYIYIANIFNTIQRH